MEAGMTREAAERVVRGEMPPALPDRAPPRLTFSTDNPKAIGTIPNILNFVDDPAYQILEKDLIPELVMMSPDEYISEASRILSRQSPGDIDFDNVVRSRTQDMEYLQGIQDLLDQGADFQVPFLDYKRGGQEGLHRAISARNLGEEQIPVMVMRSARGDNYIPLTQAEQDAINAARLEDLRAKGYPESTIEKILRQKLSMSPEARRNRAYDQGKKTRLYHAGSPELATATELDPDAGRFARAGSGTWMTPDPVLANTYVPAGAENAGTMYEFLVDDSQFPMFVGSGNWDEVVGDLIGPRPEYKTLLEDVSGSTNEIARQVREMGYPGMSFSGISDVGPNYQAAKRSAEMLADRDRMDPKELLEGTIGDRAENPDVYTIFDPSVARSPLAAFDPEQVDSPNLMAGLGPAAVGAGLFGAAMAPDEAEAAALGDYDQRAVAVATEALDRLQREAKMSEGEIGPQEVLEAAATIGSSILGSVPAGLAGLYTLATTGDREAAEAKINEITESLTYMPTSQGSIDSLQAAAGPLEALAAPSEYVGQKTMDITGSPFLATASEIFLDPLNLLSFGGLGAALKRAGRAQ